MIDVAAYLAANLPPAPADQATVERFVAVVPMTEEAIVDAEAFRPAFDEWLLRERLRSLGFPGLVRCYWCRRPTRCVYLGRVGWSPSGGIELFGRSCRAKYATDA